jgi:hypothetical protein
MVIKHKLSRLKLYQLVCIVCTSPFTFFQGGFDYVVLNTIKPLTQKMASGPLVFLLSGKIREKLVCMYQ